MANSVAPTSPRKQFIFTVGTVLLVSGVIIACWLHTRDILRDLADYTTVITAAGKVEAGLKPYADVRSPIQSSIYVLNYLTEQVFGRNYLALTWGGLVQALGGAWLLQALLVTRWGPVRAAVVALAVAMAGLLQHTVFFYNPIGILCLAVACCGVAVEPALRPLRSWRAVAVLAALGLGGINKLNFHGATLVLTGLLALGAWSNDRINGRALGQTVLLLGLGGIVVPLGFELLWTGASLAQWVHNVILLPTERINYIGEAANWRMYFQPVHDFHHHVVVRPIAGIGLLLLLAVGGWVIGQAWRRPGAWVDRMVRLLLVGSGVGLGALLMITNHETIMLTSLPYLVMTVALCLAYTHQGERVAERMSWGITVVALIWLGAGGYAAWHGSRVLFGPNPPDESAYVRSHSTDRALSYFNGVRLMPEQIDANERLAAKVRAMQTPEGRLTNVLFGPGLEWMERGYPEAIVRGEPIGYHAGTTLHEGDLAYFKTLLADGQRRLVTQRNWESWPPSISRYLSGETRGERISGRDRMYHPRAKGVPVVELASPAKLPADSFRDATGGNVLITSTRHSVGMQLEPRVSGAIFGAAGNTHWSWSGAYDAEGKAVAWLQPGNGATATVIFRALAGDPESGELLWEYPVALGPQRAEVVLPVVLQPGGRPVWLQTAVPEGGAAIAGWREMRITRTNEQDRSAPRPFGRELTQIWPAPPEAVVNQVWFGRTGQQVGGDGAAVLPVENWRRDTLESGKLSVTVEFVADTTSPGDRVIVTLAWLRGNRFEIMTEREIDVREVPRLTLDAYVPEAGGWVGVLARTGAAHHRMRVLHWTR